MAGFFDNYESASGLNFVKGEEKAILIEDRVPLTVVAIKRVSGTYEGHPQEQYILVFTIEDEDDEARALGFTIGGVESRDDMLRQMQDYLNNENGDDIVPPVVELYKVGRYYLLREAGTGE